MDNIEEILRALTEDDDAANENDAAGESSQSSEDSGGLFGSLDPKMLLTMLSLFESMNSHDDNEKFLLALKPLLREENRHKVDSAMRFMKLFALLPALRDSGIIGKLF